MANYVDGGYELAKAVIEKIGGKGNILMVSGIAGVNTSDSFDKGALKRSRNIRTSSWPERCRVNGPTRLRRSRFRSSWRRILNRSMESCCSRLPKMGVLQAMLQSGRPVVPMSLQGEAGAACYWRQHPEWADTAFYIWPPGGEIYFGWNVTLRILQGQGPKIQSIVRKVMKYSYEDNKAQVSENCKTDDPNWLEPKARTGFLHLWRIRFSFGRAIR